MDLALYFRVLWRFRLIVLAGLILAVVLTFFSMAKLEFKNGIHVSYRKPETWASTTTLMLTQNGFPLGRTTFAGTGQLSSLAVLYANLASSDSVRQIMAKEGPIDGAVSAQAVAPPNNPTYPLPLLAITASATDPGRPAALAARASRALRTYIFRRQEQSGTPANQRVVLDELAAPQEAALVAGRKKTLPITVFLAVLIATLGLAFILENLRPRLRSVSVAEPQADPRPRDRRSA